MAEHFKRLATVHDKYRRQGKRGNYRAPAVREAFPAATIIRPSLVVGPEDQITNRLAPLRGDPPSVRALAPLSPEQYERLARWFEHEWPERRER